MSRLIVLNSLRIEYIVVGTKGGHLVLWSTKSLRRKPLKLFYGDGGEIVRLHFVDGTEPVLLCLSSSGTMFCLSLNSFQTLWQRTPPKEENTAIICFCSGERKFGSMLCFGTNKGSLGMIKVVNGER